MMKYCLVLKGIIIFAIFFFSSLPTSCQDRNEVLLVDDDAGSSLLDPWKSGLRSYGKSFDILDTNQTPVALELLEKYNLVLWVTGGGSGDLSSSEMNVLEDYMDSDGCVLVSGENTGSDLDSGWLDDSYFGFEFEKNTRNPVRIKSFESSVRDFDVSTDYGTFRNGKIILGFESNEENNNNGLSGKVCGTKSSHFFTKTVWLGFNVDDVSTGEDDMWNQAFLTWMED